MDSNSVNSVSSLRSSAMFLGKLTAVLLVGRVLAGVAVSYADYMPPNFHADFLLGREAYFWQGYHWPFYLHIVTGPITLALGLVLMSARFRRRFPRGHRDLGRSQAMLVLFFVVPSGLGMAWYAAAGTVAALGFASLAVVTGMTVICGWRAARQRRFPDHARWMQRNYVLLCSAIVVRLNGGLGEILQIDANWYYAQTAWTSWLVPLALLEVIRWTTTFQRTLRTFVSDLRFADAVSPQAADRT